MKVFSVILILFFSCHLSISEEFCSVVEKRSKELKPCKFPFKFDGKTYEKCTVENDPANKLWCSTNVDENGDHIRSGGYWGHCAQNCMTNLLQKNAEVYIPTNDKCGDNTDPTRVYQSSKAGFWPWMASIGSSSNGEWNHECGATLISQTSIITAAHCVADDNKNRLKIRLGDTDLKSNTDDKNVQEIEIEEIHKHPKYIEEVAYYDIAVLKVRPVVFTAHVKPICLPNPENFKIDKYEGHSSTLIGWGASTDDGKPDPILRRTILTIYDYSYCNETHEKTSGQVATTVKKFLPQLFHPNVLCAGYESANQGSCKGDSGGPLMVFDTKKSKFFQVGVVVGGVSSCESKSIPACYTRLDHPEIADFVQSAGKKNSREVIISRTIPNNEEKPEGEMENAKKDELVGDIFQQITPILVSPESLRNNNNNNVGQNQGYWTTGVESKNEGQTVNGFYFPRWLYIG